MRSLTDLLGSRSHSDCVRGVEALSSLITEETSSRRVAVDPGQNSLHLEVNPLRSAAQDITTRSCWSGILVPVEEAGANDRSPPS